MNKTVIWGTEVSDTSGILLAQAMDAHFVKYSGDANTYSDDDAALLKSKNTNIIFLGAVKLPSWLKYDKTRMFNDPNTSRDLLQKEEVLAKLGASSKAVVVGHPLTDKTSYGFLSNKFGSKFNLVLKTNNIPVGVVTDQDTYVKLTTKTPKKSLAACPVLDFTKRMRIFVTSKDDELSGVIGAVFSEKRQLSFRESLEISATEEAKNHISNLFSEGLLKDSMGTGVVAWTDDVVINAHSKYNRHPLIEAINTQYISSIINNVNENYELDMWCLDIVFVPERNEYLVTNIVTAPSLQMDGVLKLVATYYNELIKMGRKMTKEQLIKMASEFNEEQLAKMAELMKQAKVVDCSIT